MGHGVQGEDWGQCVGWTLVYFTIFASGAHAICGRTRKGVASDAIIGSLIMYALWGKEVGHGVEGRATLYGANDGDGYVLFNGAGVGGTFKGFDQGV